MVTVKIADQAKVLQEVTPEWITSTINRNRITGKGNPIEVQIESTNANLTLFANCSKSGTANPSNEIESRIVFLWEDMVLSKRDLDPSLLHEFLKRMDRWVSFVPKN